MRRRAKGDPTILEQFAGDPSLEAVAESSSWKSAAATILVLAAFVAITFATPGMPEPSVAPGDAVAQVALGSPAP
jgi:hypothetical protein